MSEVKKIVLDEGNVEDLYSKARNHDPFAGEIPPALLNSADIIKYVEATGMINPFYIGEDFIKPASYSLRIKGKYKYWDSKQDPVEGSLEKENDFFILRRNTVAFVTLESKIRLPHYIAARFNLQIKHVHRGILLGTGPLVDPGFKGDLFIPLHNLTNNDYKIKCLEPLIWMEFTKISNSSEFTQKMADKSDPPFYSFKNTSLDIDPYTYLVKAAPHTGIVNSISTLVPEAEQLQKKSEALISRINLTALFSIITLSIGLCTFVYNMWTVRKDSFDYVNKSMEKQQALENNLAGEVKQREADKKKLDSLVKEVDQIKQKKLRQP